MPHFWKLLAVLTLGPLLGVGLIFAGDYIVGTVLVTGSAIFVALGLESLMQ